MTGKKQWLMLFSACLFSMLSHAQEKYSKVKLPVTSEEIRKFAFNNLNIDHFNYEGNAMLLVLNSEELQSLKNAHYPFELLVDDVVKATIDENRNIVAEISTGRAPLQGDGSERIANIIATPALFGNGGTLRLGASASNPGYFTYADMVAKMQQLATNYPNLVSVYSIGTTAVAADGAPAQTIYGVKISDNVSVDENEPEVLYTGMQHAREAIGGTSMIFFMQYLAENYSNPDNIIKELVDNREIFIIPCVNPQGYMYNYSGASGYPVTGGGLWRKNRRHTGGGASNIGVDLNRNYSVDFANCAGASSSCGSTNPTSDTYFGTAAFSEPETRAIRDFVYSRNFVNSIDQHCYGPYYSLPYGRPSLHAPYSHEDSAYYRAIPALMGYYNGHRAGNSPETVNYEVAGGIKDWLLLGDIGVGSKGKIYGMTGEAGGGNFWAPVSQIIQLCKENCFQNLQLAYAAGAYYDVQDLDDMAIPSGNITGNLSCQVRKIGLGNGQVTISFIPILNITTSTPPITTTISNYFDTYDATFNYTLPGSIAAGHRIEFVWKVEAGGIAVYDTVIKFYSPVTMLNENMEGSFATNWTAIPSGSANWGFTTLSAFGGTHSMTESPLGNYTTSSTRTVTCNTFFNLADATEAYINFWVWHRSENFRDKLQLQVSTNGITWTAVSGSTTVMENNTTNGGTLGGQPALTGIRNEWTRETYNISAYIGFSNVRFRFVFTSDSDASAFAFERDNGFFIDNVKLFKSTVLTPLAVAYINLDGKMLPGKVVQLDWESAIDDDFDHFVIEKSVNGGVTYNSIGQITNTTAPFRYLDHSPVPGNNYYRVRRVDHNGNYLFSRTVRINNNLALYAINVYPNPVVDIMKVRFQNTIASEKLTFSIIDGAGRKVLVQKSTIAPGAIEVMLNLKGLAQGIYILKVSNKNNETLGNQKFIKE
ncbi:MAG TPA: M14 family zinc carboxypeptidase [Ferruginibacter sp.]|nr:M14 family zinc carboxypeptidase [Ferruginibacter sp.]